MEPTEKRAGLPEPSISTLEEAVQACILNADRLIDDIYALEFHTPPATNLALAIIAQEECAKAFLLYLVREGIIPWSRELLRAMNDHACKQLVGIIMDYADPQWEEVEDYRKLLDEEYARDGRLPLNVSTAFNLLRHEKMGRWESKAWCWAEDPEYDKTVMKVGEGKRDALKQDALYVRLSKDGRVISTPNSVSSESAEVEIERAKQYRGFVRAMIKDGWRESIFHNRVREAFTILFEKAS